MQRAVDRARVMDDVGLVERRAQHRGVADLAAHAAAQAVVVDVRHRMVAERVRVGLDGQRRAARQPDAGVIAGTYVVVDAEPSANDALALGQFPGVFGADASIWTL